MFTITNEWLGENSLGGHSFSGKQLSILGVIPTKGWRKRLIGLEITKENKELFESSSVKMPNKLPVAHKIAIWFVLKIIGKRNVRLLCANHLESMGYLVNICRIEVEK